MRDNKARLGLVDDYVAFGMQRRLTIPTCLRLGNPVINFSCIQQEVGLGNMECRIFHKQFVHFCFWLKPIKNVEEPVDSVVNGQR